MNQHHQRRNGDQGHGSHRSDSPRDIEYRRDGRRNYYNGNQFRGRFEDEYDEFIDRSPNNRDYDWYDHDSYYGYGDRRHRSFFDEAGRRIRDTWHRFTHRNEHPDNYYNEDLNYRNYGNNTYHEPRENGFRNFEDGRRHDPGFFERAGRKLGRAGERLKEAWHDLRQHRPAHEPEGGYDYHPSEFEYPGSYRRTHDYPYDRYERRYGNEHYSRNHSRDRGYSQRPRHDW